MIVESKGPAAADVDGPGPPAMNGRAYWPIALLVLGLVLALLGAAFFLDQRYRPRLGLEPAAATAPTPEVAARAAPQLNAPTVGGPVATAIPTTAAAAAAVVAPTTLATTALPATAPVAASTADAAVVQSAAPPSAAELLTPLKKEIVDAYLRYWDVRTRAYYDLDTSHLPEVMDGAELARERQGVEELRSQGRAANLDIEHNLRIRGASFDEATIYDEYVNRSVFLDARTKVEMPTTEPPATRKITFLMRRFDGRWKVVDGERNE